MNKILSLCINCLLLVISDAVPVKLIAGDRSVVKKDGATHTISKYYVVPNDYDPNNVTNTTTASATQKAAVRMHSLYTKSMASGIIDEEINENKATKVNDQSHSNVTVEIKNPQVNFGSDLNVGQGEVTNQLDDSTESTVSMSTEQSLDSDDLGNLQVEPIIDPININRKFTDEININVNSGEAVQNGSPFIVINETEPTDIEDKLDDLILTKFGVAVYERYSQNLESYWKLIKLNVDRNSGDDELLAAVEKLSLLLNIFTNLYEASQLKKPVAKMIDGIIEILQIPFVEKSIGKEIQAETNISGDYDEECLRKCVRRSSKQQLDSNGTSLSETEGRQASDSSELENLQRRHRGDSDDKDLSKMSDDPDSNQVADSNEPINVLRSQLSLPYNLNVGVPDGYNALTSETTLTLDDVARNNYIQKDLYSMEMIPDSKETVENLDDQPMTIESRIIDVQPLTIKSRTADDLPSTIEDKNTEYFSWTSQNIPDDGLPWHIEDKTSAHHPFMIEHRTTNKLPWSIKSRTDPTWTSEDKNTEYFPWPSETTPDDGLPWHIEDKTSAHHPFMIEHRTTNKLPWSIKSRTDPTWTSEDKNTEYFPWPSETIPNDGLPWHIEDKTSAHHPFMIEHRTTNKLPWSIKSKTDPTWTIENKKDHSPITATALFQSGVPSVTTHGRNIIFNPNQPIKSTVHNVINRTKKPYHIYTYVINPTTPLYKVPNAGNGAQMVSRQPYENLETTLHALPTLHGGNQVVYENQPSRSQYEPQYSLSKPTIDISSQPSYSQLTHTNYPTKTYDSSLEVNPSTLHSQTPQEDNELQYLVGHGSEINHKPALQSNTLHSESQPDSGEENEAPTVPEIDSLPGDLLMNVPSNPFGSMISHGNAEPDSTESANSTGSVVTSDVDPNIDDQHTRPNSYNPNDNGNLIQPSTNPAMVNKARQSAHASVQTSQYPGFFSSSASSSTHTNEPDEPDYGGQIHQQPDTISTASAHSETNVQDDYDVHTPVYKEDTNNYPGFISQATAHSEYTNVPKDYTNLAPDNGQYTYTRPGQISKVHQYLVHPNVWDDSIPVNGIQIQKYPGYISKASSHSKFNVPVNYNVPTQYYGDDTDFHPGKIQNFRDYSEINHHTKVQPVNSGPTQYGDNYLVPYQPYVHKVHVIHQPHVINHLIQTIPGNQNLKLKLAPTYRLLTVQNLKNLENAIIKTIQMYGPGVHDDRALINLKKIIKIILLLAENLEETGGTNPWYENIFYNSQHSQHPLQTYVYKLIRQRWLHELMLVLYKNNFSTNILQHPGIFSFLESWQFPNYVQDFMKSEELTHVPNPQDYDDISYNQNDLQNKFSTHTYGDLFKDVPENLEKYVTDNYFDSYKSPNDGIVVSIGGVEAQPDANVIIQILQNYLHHKSNIETQEDVIIRDNKVEMLKQIILFLKEKGYGPNTIADLIRKLYSAVYSTEGRGCHTHHTNFAKNMYDVILPVLRRSGR